MVPDPAKFTNALQRYRRAVEEAARAEVEVERAEREMQNLVYVSTKKEENGL